MPANAPNLSKVKRSRSRARPSTGVCIVCGKTFSRYVQSAHGHRQWNGRKSTCSTKCSNKLSAIYKAEHKGTIPKHRKGQVLVKCTCGNLHWEPPERSNMRMCRACAEKADYCYSESDYGKLLTA